MSYFDEDFWEEHSRKVDEAIEVVRAVLEKGKLTWREAYPYLRGRYSIAVRDDAVMRLLEEGEVYDDGEYTEEFLNGEGKNMSKEKIIAHLEARLIDLDDMDVVELLDKLEDS